MVIEVTPSDPSVDSVRLFLGRSDRTEDATLELPTGTTANGVTRSSIAGVTYFPRDANNELDTKAIKSGEKATFVFVRDAVTDLGAVIAVGYAGQQIKEVATLFDVHLPATHFDKYTLTLAPPARPPVAWSETFPVPPSQATCIGITDPATQDPFSVSFIVSPDDPDCDGLPKDDPSECNNQAWFGKRPASLDELSCLVAQVDTATCFLGGPECIDGMAKSPQSQCAPTNYCVPKRVCTACAGQLSCAEDITKNPTATPFGFGFDCDLRTANGDTCEDELVLTMGPIDGLDCTAAAIGDSTHPFSDHIDLAKQSIFVKLDGGCQIRLVVKGSAPDSNTADIGLMIAVDLDNGRGVAMPIVLHVNRQVSECAGMPVACSLDPSVAGAELADCAAPWSPPVIEPGLVGNPAPANMRSPSLTADELDLWFVADGAKIMHSSRPSKIALWSPPQVETLLSSAMLGQGTTAARVSPDGLTMYVSGERNISVGGTDIYMSTRASRAEPWTQLAPAGMVNTIRNEMGGSVDGGGHLLAYSAEVDAGASTFSHLFVSTRGTTGTAWGSGTPLPGNGTGTNDYNPHISDDGKSLYFSSDAAETFGHELFVMSRQASGGLFSMPRRLTALGSDKDDDDPWVSPDQRTIYFASNRGTGMYRIYRATR